MRTFISYSVSRMLCGALAALMVIGCGTTSTFTPGVGRKFSYSYRLVSPTQSRGLFFQDGRVRFQFAIDEAAVTFRLQNTTDQPIHLMWGEASMAVNNRATRVRHASDLYSDSIAGGTFTLPPQGFVRDLVMPASNIRSNETSWVETDLFPTTDRGNDRRRQQILRNVGKQLKFFLPVRFGEEVVRYEFGFEVTSVTEIRWRDYTPVTREPAPPRPETEPSRYDKVTVALVAVGFLSIFVFLMRADKTPPAE